MWDISDEEIEHLIEATMAASVPAVPRPFKVIKKRRASRLAGVLGTLKMVKKQYLRNPYKQKAIKFSQK